MTVAEPSIQVKRIKKRAIKLPAGEGKKKQRFDAGASFHLVDESSDDSDIEVVPPALKEGRGMTTEGGLNVGASGSGLPPAGPTPSAEGVEGYTLLRFRSGRGWLGEESQGEAPLEALNAFSLSPDKQYLDREDDETLTRKAQEALGTVSCFKFFSFSLLLFSSLCLTHISPLLAVCFSVWFLLYGGSEERFP